MNAPDLLLRVQHLRSQREPFVLATVVRAERPTSAKPGDSALVLPDGTVDGFVGGVCAEATVRLQGLKALRTGESTLLRITPDPNGAEPPPAEPQLTEARLVATDVVDRQPTEGLVTVANPCLSGGTLEIFLAAMIPPPLVQVFGDTPVARAMMALGTALGYAVTLSTDPDLPVPADAAAVVVASHGRDEERVLAAALAAGIPYVALVASRRRGAAVLAELDLDETDRARLHTPAGLDIGARSAPEVALSIFAELIASRPRLPTGPAVDSLPQTAVDPVCGMAVAITADALRLEVDGHTWYFCGTGCRTAFADRSATQHE